ncbi:hypothetical protein Gpo141_00009199 [Globisporangium polare]
MNNNFGSSSEEPDPFRARSAATTAEHEPAFNMLVDLSLVSDSFLDFDDHDAFELQSLDVTMLPSSSATSSYSASGNSSSSASKGQTFASATPKSSNDQNFTISASADPRANTDYAKVFPTAATSKDLTQAGAGIVSTASPPTEPAPAPASTEEDRRKRTNALKTRILDMRDELSALEKQRERLQEKGAAILATRSSESNAAIETNKDFMEIMGTIDHLRSEKAALKKQIQQWDMQNSTYQTIVTEFKGETKRLKRLEAGIQPQNEGNIVSDEEKEEIDAAMYSEDAPIFQKILFPRPMTREEALQCVGSSCKEIMAFREQKDFESLGGEVLGWRDKRILDQHSLQFMLAQHFASVLPQELVWKTWDLLTVKDMYQRIQPRTTELKILQRVTADCVIVRLSVDSGEQQHHTILLIARGQIDGGYLITYRSIPLSEGKQRFAESEGTYVSIFNWFMFLDKTNRDGAPGCEVIFGGKVKNRSAEYLRYLMMEVVAGVVRWQTAVGYSKLRLMN